MPIRRVPIYGLVTDPAGPRVVVRRIDHTHPLPHSDHTHDFFVLAYFDQAAPTAPVRAGDLFVVAPGEVVGAAAFALGDHGLHGVSGWSVMFDAALLGAAPAASPLAWGTHPLLSPFVGGRRPGIARLFVAPAARAAWVARIAALEAELRERRGGHHAAATAHLTLLLVDVARLVDGVDGGVVTDLQLNREPLLGEVFAVIERRFTGPLSLRDVAKEVGISAGHLTTRVRERTGRTVLEWITERRLVEARRLLATTDAPVAAVAAAVGIPDPGYFARIFRRAHGVSPAAWRGRAGPG
jgi:AraC family transcriptional activator of pobA